jgi:putative sigma-54 modulation protein
MEPGPSAGGAKTDGQPSAGAAAARSFAIIKDERFAARSMTVEDAVMQLNLVGDELLVFTDARTGGISVLHRRQDGNYGLIETGPAGGGPNGR